MNKDLVGQDAAVLGKFAGVGCPKNTQILFGETGEDHPFVEHEQMMPFIPFVRVPNVDRAIDLAKKSEHGYGHTAVLHSRDTEVMSKMGRAMDCTIFVVNGPSRPGSAIESRRSRLPGRRARACTTPLTFCRQRRTAIAGGLKFRNSFGRSRGANRMQIGLVLGTATATMKHPSFAGSVCSWCRCRGPRPRRWRPGPGVRSARGRAGRSRVADERRDGLAGSTRAIDARPLERDGVARRMNEPTIAQVDAAVRSVLSGLLGKQDGSRLDLRGEAALAQACGGMERRGNSRGAGTIVTPLARDQLKKMGVALKIVSEREVGNVSQSGEWGFAMEAESGMIAALRRRLLAGEPSWSLVGNTAREAGEWVARRENRGAAVITSEAAVAGYVANQIAGVRAATLGDADAVSRAIRSLGVNLAVIEPAGNSLFSLMHMLQTYRRGGPPSRRIAPTGGPDHANRRGDRASHPVPRPSQPAQRPIRGRGDHDPVGVGGRFVEEG